MLTHAELKAKALEDPKVRKAYNLLEAKYLRINKLIKAKQKKLSKDI